MRKKGKGGSTRRIVKKGLRLFEVRNLRMEKEVRDGMEGRVENEREGWLRGRRRGGGEEENLKNVIILMKRCFRYIPERLREQEHSQERERELGQVRTQELKERSGDRN